MRVTTAEVYAIQPDEYGWRHLPDGRRIRVGADVTVVNWARVGEGARVGNWASVGEGAKIGPEIKIESTRDVLTIDFLDSRKDTLTAVLVTTPITISTGCFTGTIDEFAAAVTHTHRDNDYAREYRAAIAFIRAVAEARGKSEPQATAEKANGGD